MMVASTEGRMSIVNFEMYFFSIKSLSPRRVVDAGTLRRIEGSTATDRWQLSFPMRVAPSGLQFDFEEHDFGIGFVKHVVLHAGLAEIGFPDAKLRPGPFAVWRHDGHLARSHRHDHIVHL